MNLWIVPAEDGALLEIISTSLRASVPNLVLPKCELTKGRRANSLNIRAANGSTLKGVER